jgi:uncharacterized protein YjbJ (UPF0337 family)
MTSRSDEIKGGLKEGLVKLTGNAGLAAEGRTQRTSGRARRKIRAGRGQGAIEAGVWQAPGLADPGGRSGYALRQGDGPLPVWEWRCWSDHGQDAGLDGGLRLTYRRDL